MVMFFREMFYLKMITALLPLHYKTNTLELAPGASPSIKSKVSGLFKHLHHQPTVKCIGLHAKLLDIPLWVESERFSEERE